MIWGAGQSLSLLPRFRITSAGADGLDLMSLTFEVLYEFCYIARRTWRLRALSKKRANHVQGANAQNNYFDITEAPYTSKLTRHRGTHGTQRNPPPTPPTQTSPTQYDFVTKCIQNALPKPALHPSFRCLRTHSQPIRCAPTPPAGFQGGKSIVGGFASGMKGVVANTVGGAKEGGVGGFFKGAAKGLVGGVVKIGVGAADGVLNVAQVGAMGMGNRLLRRLSLLLLLPVFLVLEVMLVVMIFHGGQWGTWYERAAAASGVVGICRGGHGVVMISACPAAVSYRLPLVVCCVVTAVAPGLEPASGLFFRHVRPT